MKVVEQKSNDISMLIEIKTRWALLPYKFLKNKTLHSLGQEGIISDY